MYIAWAGVAKGTYTLHYILHEQPGFPFTM